MLAAMIAGASAITTADAEKVAQGIITGALNTTDGRDFSKCVKDVTIIVQNLENAYADFKLRTKDGIISGVHELAGLSKVLYSASVDCVSLYQAERTRLKSMADSMSSYTSFFWNVSSNFVNYSTDIFNNVEKAINDRSSSQYYAFGKDVGTIASILIFGEGKLLLNMSEVYVPSWSQPMELYQVYPVEILLI